MITKDQWIFLHFRKLGEFMQPPSSSFCIASMPDENGNFETSMVHVGLGQHVRGTLRTYGTVYFGGMYEWVVVGWVDKPEPKFLIRELDLTMRPLIEVAFLYLFCWPVFVLKNLMRGKK